MPRSYTVDFENVTVSAAQDLVELTPADDKVIAITAINIANVGGTGDAGDAQEEDLRITINRGNTTSGSGGSAPTPQPDSGIDTAAGFTAEANNTTRATSGTKVVLFADGWNVRVPYEKTFTPEQYKWASQAQTLLTVALEAAPADALSVSGTIHVIEYP